MKNIAALLMLLGFVVTTDTARSQAVTADDVKWINQCVADNKGLAAADVIRKYCMCMNEEMDDSETRTITQFEKANPKARAKCDKVSGWK